MNRCVVNLFALQCGAAQLGRGGTPPAIHPVRGKVLFDGAPPRNRLPVRYSLTSSSGLRARVAAGDNELPVFELKK